jgi:hypothetical protein
MKGCHISLVQGSGKLFPHQLSMAPERDSIPVAHENSFSEKATILNFI